MLVPTSAASSRDGWLPISTAVQRAPCARKAAVTARPMPPAAPVSRAWRSSRRRVIADARCTNAATRSLGGSNLSYQAWIAGQRTPQDGVATERVHRIARLADGVGRGRIHGLIVIRVRDLTTMPALQEREKQRGKHRDAGYRRILRQALAHRRSDEARDLGVAIHRHPLIGVADGGIAEALQHDIAVGGAGRSGWDAPAWTDRGSRRR